jgi:putative tricarboxylic transport membrane protein
MADEVIQEEGAATQPAAASGKAPLRRDHLITGLAAIIGGGFYLYADSRLPIPEIGDPLGPRAFPAIIGVGIVASGALSLLEGMRTRAARSDAAHERPHHPSSPVILATTLLWSLVYVLIFERLGYRIATVIYVFPLLCLFHRNYYFANAVIALLFSAISYFVFAHFLGVAMPIGPFGL